MKWLDTWIRNDRNWCRAVKADGWSGLIQGAFSGGLAAPLYPEMRDHCQEALRNARQEGLLTAAYTNAAPWRSPLFWFEKTIDHIGSELQYLSFIAVDHELMEEGRPTDQDMRTFIDLLKGLGKPLIGYSADWFLGLRAAHGFRTQWPDRLDGYWHARYNTTADWQLNRPRWMMDDRLVGKQYSGSTQIHGKTVDLNDFDSARIDQLGGEEDDVAYDESAEWFKGKPKRALWQATDHLNRRDDQLAEGLARNSETIKRIHQELKDEIKELKTSAGDGAHTH